MPIYPAAALLVAWGLSLIKYKLIPVGLIFGIGLALIFFRIPEPLFCNNQFVISKHKIDLSDFNLEHRKSRCHPFND